MTDTARRQLDGLSTILNLERRSRRAETREELGFIIVNETHNLIPYRQSVFWEKTNGRARVRALSGVSRVERDAPFVQWLGRVMPWLDRDSALPDPRPVDGGDLADVSMKGWDEWFPRYGLWVPMTHPSGRRLGALLLARDDPWEEHEQKLIGHLAESYAYAWSAVEARRGLSERLAGLHKGWKLPAVIVLAAGLSFVVPVRLSVLAPAEVVPDDPWVVRAPIDGVVETMHVRPNQHVKAGQALLNLDPAQIGNKLGVARRELAVAEAEYRQAAQKAVFDRDSKARLVVLDGKRKIQSAEVSYLEELLSRVEVRAKRAGIAIYGGPSEWIGRPVQTGERILTIANPTRVRLEVSVSIEDAISLEPGAEVLFYLAATLETPLPAVVERAAYEALPTPSGTLAYRLVARFGETATPPRIGIKGTAKVYGDEVPLAYFLLRRPYSAVRRWLGI